MPRPKRIADDQVLDATRQLMLHKGEAFTLTDVAEAVGLSRAALIQRFGNRAGLERQVAEHGLRTLRQLAERHPVALKGPHPLLPFLDQVLGTLEIGVLTADEATTDVLREAIVARLDEPSRQRAGEVADILICVLRGAAAQGKGAGYVAARLRLALKLIYAGAPDS